MNRYKRINSFQRMNRLTEINRFVHLQFAKKMHIFSLPLLWRLMVNAEEEDEQKVGYATEEGVRRRRWKSGTTVQRERQNTSCFIREKSSRQKRGSIDPCARGESYYIYTYRYSHPPDCLPICLSTCQRDRLSWLLACLPIHCHHRCDPSTNSSCRSSLAVQ